MGTGVCHHIPGITCANCAGWNQPSFSVPVHPTPGPFKCTDCGAWWVGWYHACPEALANRSAPDTEEEGTDG